MSATTYWALNIYYDKPERKGNVIRLFTTRDAAEAKKKKILLINSGIVSTSIEPLKVPSGHVCYAWNYCSQEGDVNVHEMDGLDTITWDEWWETWGVRYQDASPETHSHFPSLIKPTGL